MIKRASQMAANHDNIEKDLDRSVFPSSARGRKRGKR